MKIRAMLSVDESPKYSSYLINVSGHSIALDFGGLPPKDFDLSSLETIVLSHDHRDHYEGLLLPENLSTLLSKALDGSLEIYATSTTKKLLMERSFRINGQEKPGDYAQLLSTIKVLPYFKPTRPHGGLDYEIELLPSFHTFGSAMVYLNSKEPSLLYTGDLGEKAADYYSDCYTGQLKIDYLLSDSTNLSRSYLGVVSPDIRQVYDLLSDTNNHISAGKVEKAPFLAYRLINEAPEDDYAVVYGDGVSWYVKVLAEEGYKVFLKDRIFLGDEALKDRLPKDKKIIYLDGHAMMSFEQMVDLHIAPTSYFRFLASPLFKASEGMKIIFSHYDRREERVAILKDFLAKYDLASRSVLIGDDPLEAK
jgi:hypothetical protein